jgi:hypothetical protein
MRRDATSCPKPLPNLLELFRVFAFPRLLEHSSSYILFYLSSLNGVLNPTNHLFAKLEQWSTGKLLCALAPALKYSSMLTVGSVTGNKRKRGAEKPVHSDACTDGACYPWLRPSFSTTVSLELEDGTFSEPAITVDEQILVNNSDTIKAIYETAPSETASNIVTIPKWRISKEGQSILLPWLFMIHNPAAGPADLAHFVTREIGNIPIANSPPILLTLCRIWCVAWRVADYRGRNRLMDTIFHITGDDQERQRSGCEMGWHEVLRFITWDSRIPPNTALYRWLVDHVARSGSPIPLAEFRDSSSVEFRVLVCEEIMRLRHWIERPRPASAYHVAVLQ